MPKGAEPIPGPCAELAEMGAVEFLTGPATFLNESVVQIDNQLRRLAENVPADRFREYLLAVATKYGITSIPSITNEEFVATVVFDLAAPAGHAEGAPRLPLPERRSAQIVIRLKPDLSEAERHRAIGLIEAAVEDTTPRKRVQGRRQAGALLRARERRLRRLRRPGRDRRRLAGAEGRPPRPLRGRRWR